VTNVVDSLITDMLSLEHLSRSNRRLAIRNKLTEFEEILEHNSAGPEQIRSVLQDAKDRAFQEIARHSSRNVLTATAELYDEVFEQLRLRIATSIKELKDGTFQIIVSLPGEALPHVARDGFPSQTAAVDWRDSDLGATYVKSILDKR
jgi:hypothetical protein